MLLDQNGSPYWKVVEEPARELGDDDEPKQPSKKAAAKKKYKKFMTCFKIWFAIFSAAGFAMFIIEEASQQRGFGAYTMVQSKDWEAAADAINLDMRMCQVDKRNTLLLTPLNPFMGYFFYRYHQQVEQKIEWQMARIEKELKGRQIDGGIIQPKQISKSTSNRIKVTPDLRVARPGGKAYHQWYCTSVEGKAGNIYMQQRAEWQGSGLKPCSRCCKGG
jgi:hypothetical protein